MWVCVVIFFLLKIHPNFKKNFKQQQKKSNVSYYSNSPRAMKTKCGYFPRTEDSWNTEFSVQNWESSGQSEIAGHLT